MALVMAAGSFVAGSTSMGGGAVAFPVMTLAFDISPSVARDFSLMIQSVGMMAASAAIVMMWVTVEKKALLWAGIGGLPGLLFGYEVLSPLLAAAVVKTLFASVVFSFGLMLWWTNRYANRFRVTTIRRFGSVVGLELFAAGLAGGIISGILGSGIDIAVFSVLVLRFGICEKVATPTSVILMGTNALAGMLWGGASGTLAAEAWDYWWVCVPVVAFGAPFGAWCMSRWRRVHIVRFICVLILVQYVGTLLILPQTPTLLAWNILVIASSLLLLRLFHQACETRRTP
ncbi:sulfite exporter TauE/SafE family protein [Candidatus Thiosymbion oneisti]|uniref:sulfite exporter TauE/SafE family protein n=1 Tax=Candidatus Thiosymbion oneisti TaxID=589554 RepID=UPI000A8EB986|nr:sulfite exporter TauE/SafE family protein [Candidatus Thiosymbion oneisti]